jgi:hypothetical protein
MPEYLQELIVFILLYMYGKQFLQFSSLFRRQVMPEHLPGLIGSICNSPWSIDKDLEEIEVTL